jgi:hypothetical protein
VFFFSPYIYRFVFSHFFPHLFLVNELFSFLFCLIKGLRLVWRFMILSLNDHYLENQLVVCMMILLKSRNKNQLLLVMCDFQRVNLICLMSFLNISILIHENKKKIMWKGVCIKKKKLNDCVWFYWDFFSLWVGNANFVLNSNIHI